MRDDSVLVVRRTRDDTIAELASFPAELERLVLRGHSDDQLRQPASDGGWGVVEILPHLRDWELIYLDRIEKILSEENPDLPGFDDTLWSIEREFNASHPWQGDEPCASPWTQLPLAMLLRKPSPTMIRPQAFWSMSTWGSTGPGYKMRRARSA